MAVMSARRMSRRMRFETRTGHRASALRTELSGDWSVSCRRQPMCPEKKKATRRWRGGSDGGGYGPVRGDAPSGSGVTSRKPSRTAFHLVPLGVCAHEAEGTAFRISGLCTGVGLLVKDDARLGTVGCVGIRLQLR